MPEYFRICNWEKFQHYKRRNPPWIRLYASLLRSVRYQQLSDTSRSHLVGVFIIASAHQNKIPTSQKWLKHELCTRYPIDLKTFEKLGWIEWIDSSADASNMLATCYTRAETETDSSDNSSQSRAEAEAEAEEKFKDLHHQLRNKNGW